MGPCRKPIVARSLSASLPQDTFHITGFLRQQPGLFRFFTCLKERLSRLAQRIHSIDKQNTQLGLCSLSQRL